MRFVDFPRAFAYNINMSTATIQRKIAPILKKYGVSRAFLFGSVARGDARPASDIALLVSFERPISLIMFYEMNDALEDLLGKKVDVVTTDSLNKHFAPYVVKDMAQIYDEKR